MRSQWLRKCAARRAIRAWPSESRPLERAHPLLPHRHEIELSSAPTLSSKWSRTLRVRIDL